MLEVAVEGWDAVRGEIGALWDLLIQEARQSKRGPMPAADMALYDARADDCLCATLRRDGRLVGAWLGFLVPHPYYRGTTALIGDTVYIHPAYRGRHTKRMMDSLIEVGKQRGAGVCYVGFPVEQDHGAYMARAGFERLEVQYRKWL